MTLRQHELKRLKKEVVDHSALEVGYFEGILSALPSYSLIEAVRSLSSNGWVTPSSSEAELQNLLISEAIKALNYQDFKDVAPYLFSYPKEQREAFFYVQPVTVSRVTYDWLQSQADELFALKEDIKASRESLEAKIEELETDRLPNGDQVIGLDRVAQEILLLRSPETSYIDDWEVERAGLLYDYRQSQNYATQVLNHLTEVYPEVRNLMREAVLNRDKIDQEVLIDEDFFPQEALLSRPSFRSHQEVYRYGKNYGDFREVFPTYEAYIDATYDRHYPTDFGLTSWAMVLLPQYLEQINELLVAHGKELVTHTANDEETNELHFLAYLRDLEKESVAEVLDYLEHTVGAYLRHTLGEVAIIKLANIDPDLGYNGQAEQTFFIDHTQLWHNRDGNLKVVQERYKELERFGSIEQVKTIRQEKGAQNQEPTQRI